MTLFAQNIAKTAYLTFAMHISCAYLQTIAQNDVNSVR